MGLPSDETCQCCVAVLFGESQGAEGCLQRRAVGRKEAVMPTMAPPRDSLRQGVEVTWIRRGSEKQEESFRELEERVFRQQQPERAICGEDCGLASGLRGPRPRRMHSPP